MRRSFRSLALSGLLLLPLTSRADTFNFSVLSSDSGFNGSGMLSGNGNSDGSLTITGITGTGVTGLIAANDPLFMNDNLLFPGSSRLFDVSGIAFNSVFGSVNLFSTVAGYEVQGFDLHGNYYDLPASVTVTNAAAVTPEPPSIVLSSLGLLALAAVFLRKRSILLTSEQEISLR